MISFYPNIIDSVVLELKHKQWLKQLIRNEHLLPGNLSYYFCSDEYMIEQNKHFLNHNTYTDIITFDEKVENLVEGSVMVSVDRVKENAVMFNNVFEEELLRVIAHGTLHICGYKDKSEEDAKIMRLKENEALQLFHAM